QRVCHGRPCCDRAKVLTTRALRAAARRAPPLTRSRTVDSGAEGSRTPDLLVATRSGRFGSTEGIPTMRFEACILCTTCTSRTPERYQSVTTRVRIAAVGHAACLQTRGTTTARGQLERLAVA